MTEPILTGGHMKFAALVIAALTLSACATNQELRDEETREIAPCLAAFESEAKKAPRGQPIAEVTVNLVKPKYPDVAKAQLIPGCVVIVYDITPEGKADNFRVIQANPRGKGFVESGLQALMRSEFKKNMPSKGRVIRAEFRTVRDESDITTAQN